MIINTDDNTMIKFKFPFYLLQCDLCFIQRGYVWIPIGVLKETWLCVKLVKVKSNFKYRSIIAHKKYDKKEYLFSNLILSSKEILELVYLNNLIPDMLNRNFQDEWFNSGYYDIT